MAEEANGVVDGRGKGSDVWAHFERFRGDDERQRARCNKCRIELLADAKNGTSHLWRHARDTCTGNGSVPEQRQDARGSNNKRPRSLPLLRVEEANADLARMVAFHGYHPSFVEDRYFRSLVGRLNPDFQVPSRFDIQDMCDGILEEAPRDFQSEMERTSSKFSLAVDTVKTNEGTALYFACHFIDDEWNLRKMIVDQYRVATRCACDTPMLGIFELCLEDEHDCLWLAKNLNIHQPFSMTAEKEGNLIDRLSLMEGLGDAHESTFVDVVLHSIAQCLFDNLDRDFPSDIGRAGKKAAEITRQDREEILSKLGIDDLRPYDQQWFLLYCSLQFLHKYGSTTSEFRQLLTKLWGEIYRAIKTVSDPSRPTSHLGLVELFKVRDLLQIEGDTPRIYKDNGFKEDVEHVLELAKDKLDSSIEDSYHVLSLPLVLDPRYKLGYIEFKFPKVFGTEVAKDNISEVKEFVRETFDCYDKDVGKNTDGDPSHVTSFDQAWYEQCRLQNGRTEVAGTELDRYLKDPLVPSTDTFNILNWWKVNSSNYPKVSRMARDALAIPTSNRLSSEQISMIKNGIRADI